jgi:hypothetical protein
MSDPTDKYYTNVWDGNNASISISDGSNMNTKIYNDSSEDPKMKEAHEKMDSIIKEIRDIKRMLLTLPHFQEQKKTFYEDLKMWQC